MRSKLKAIVKNIYYQILFLLPPKIANRFVYVGADVNWSILIYEGDSPLNLKLASTNKCPTIDRCDINDAHTLFVADPFMVKDRDEWIMFFEILNKKNKKGEIGYAKSKDRQKWDYQQIILRENFHLSYPYVFEFESAWYMIPESCDANSVRLYKATTFPHSWELVTELLVGKRFVDASTIYWDGLWWMFVGVERELNLTCDELRLYYSEQLEKGWTEHPMSPIVRDNMEISRPAGRIIVLDNRLVRFGQDCTKNYGRNVTAIRIQSLTKDDYREEIINPDRPYLFELGTLECNGLGMHHLDPIKLNDHRWIACVDAKG
jgi:hypothetical protein